MKSFDDDLKKIQEAVEGYVRDTVHIAEEFEVVKSKLGEAYVLLKELDCFSDTWVKESYFREKKINEQIDLLEKEIQDAVTPENDHKGELERLNSIACGMFERDSDINMLCMSLRRTRRFLLEYIVAFIDQSLLYRCSKVDWKKIEKLL